MANTNRCFSSYAGLHPARSNQVSRASVGGETEKAPDVPNTERTSQGALQLLAVASSKEKAVGVVDTRQVVQRRAGEGVFRDSAPIPARGGSHVFRAVRTVFDTALFSSTSGDTNWVKTFTLQTLPGYTQFKALFQTYRIAFGEIWFMPHANVAMAGERSGIFATATVSTITSAPTSLTAVTRYATSVTGEGRHGQYRTFVPYAQLEVFAPSSASGPVPAPWLSTDDDGVPHWGAIALWTATSPQFGYDIVLRITVDFANPR